MAIKIAILGLAFVFSSVALADEHPLAGEWHYAQTDVSISIGDDGSFATDVTTPAGFQQVFSQPIQWVSTSPTSGYYKVYGYFSYTHGNFPFQTHCRHPVAVEVYLDQVNGGLVANFLTPTQIWAVWQSDGGHCVDRGVERRQGIFQPVVRD